MTTTEVRHEPRHTGPPRPPDRPEPRAPLVAAAIVLLLWGGWLLVPDSSRLSLLGGGPSTGSPPAAAAGQADPVPDAAAPPGQDRPVGPVQDRSAEQVQEPVDRPAGRVESPAQDRDAGIADTSGTTGTSGTTEGPARGAAGEPVEVPESGDGTFAVAPGTGDRVGDGDLVRYTVEVEGGVPLDPSQVAEVVESALADPRSWAGEGRWALQRVDADPDARIVLTSPDTTDRMCAPLRTNGEVSCRNGDDVVLNAVRWTRGATSWGDDVEGYREYVVNHELGHYLGHGHVPCPAPGKAAPVMLQQTLGLDGCTPNAWPYP